MHTGLLLVSGLLAACATPSSGRPSRGALRLDTESAARLRYGTALSSSTGTAATASVTTASTFIRLAPLLLTVLKSDGKVNELQRQLEECAKRAEREVNFPLFGNRAPTREECGEEVEVDGCPEPLTRAMLLGRKKHELALACAREVLQQLWPAPFSIEQRYRYYPFSRLLETITPEKERQLIADGCTDKLRGTIKPDLVLHSDYNLLKAALVIDFKFPCPPTNPPQWRKYYSPSPYVGSDQGKIYEEAFGSKALLMTPQGIPE